MTTFTIRIPYGMAGRLRSSDVRRWLADFSSRPVSLPADPGPGDFRVSLTLPENQVLDFAASLRSQPSSALRRLAVFRLDAGESGHSEARNVHVDPRISNTPNAAATGLVLLIQVVTAVLIIAAIGFFKPNESP